MPGLGDAFLAHVKIMNTAMTTGQVTDIVEAVFGSGGKGLRPIEKRPTRPGGYGAFGDEEIPLQPTPAEYAKGQQKRLWLEAPSLMGDKLRDNLAEQIYYSGVAGSDIKSWDDPKLHGAFEPGTMKKGIEDIKKSPGFLKMSGKSDQELKALSAESGKLMDTYFSGAAAAKQQEAQRQIAPREAELHKQAQRNMAPI